MIRWYGALLCGRAPSLAANRQEVVIRGRTTQDTKRAVLRYWSLHEARRGVQLHEFQRRCAWREDGTVVIRGAAR